MVVEFQAQFLLLRFVLISKLIYPQFRISNFENVMLRDILLLKKLCAVLIAFNTFTCEDLSFLGCVESEIKMNHFFELSAQEWGGSDLWSSSSGRRVGSV